MHSRIADRNWCAPPQANDACQSKYSPIYVAGIEDFVTVLVAYNERASIWAFHAENQVLVNLEAIFAHANYNPSLCVLNIKIDSN